MVDEWPARWGLKRCGGFLGRSWREEGSSGNFPLDPFLSSSFSFLFYPIPSSPLPYRWTET